MMNGLNKFLEHTKLNPDLTAKDIDRLVAEAREHEVFGICVPPFWVKRAKREIGDADIQLVTVVGFPLGYNMTEVKLKEIEFAIDTGADELDVVMNISAFKEKMPWTKIELAKCSKFIHERYKLMKVIIETAYLNEQEIREACKICIDVGADFVKTSTGFAGQGAQEKDIRLMRETLPSNVGIKASGGIKTFEQAMTMVRAGADRVGTSSTLKILEGQVEKFS